MQRAVVTRIHGNREIGNAIAAGIAAAIKPIESVAEPRVAEPKKPMKIVIPPLHPEKDYIKLTSTIRRRFPIRNHRLIYHKIWGIIGLLWLLAHDQI